MAKIEVKLRLKDGTEKTFGKRQIIELESNLQSTTDNSKPFYGVVPNQGTVKLLDIDGTIANLIKNDKLSRTGAQISILINGKQVHNYRVMDSEYVDEVLTLSLGDTLSYWNESKLQYSGYSHIGQLQNYNRFSDLLQDILSTVLEADKINITSEAYNALYNIHYAVAVQEQGELVQAINNICRVAQLQCFEDDDGRVTFIYCGTSNIYQPTSPKYSNPIIIKKKNQYSDINSNLFVSNQFNKINLDEKVFKISDDITIVDSYTLTLVVYSEEHNGSLKYVGDNTTEYNTEFAESYLATEGNLTGSGTTYLRTVGIHRKDLQKPIVPDSILRVEKPNYYSSAKADVSYYMYDLGQGEEVENLKTESIKISKSWGLGTDSKGIFYVFGGLGNDQGGTLAFNLKIREQNWIYPYGSMQIDIYDYTYSLDSREATFEVSTDGERYQLESSELLMNTTTYGLDIPIAQHIADNIFATYASGLHSATVTISCADYYNQDGKIAKNLSNGEILNIYDIITLDGDDRQWLITGRKFRYAGVPFIDLELLEIKNPYQYILNLNVENAKLTVTRISSPIVNAKLGKLKNGDKIYKDDVLHISAIGEKWYVITGIKVNDIQIDNNSDYTVNGDVSILVETQAAKSFAEASIEEINDVSLSGFASEYYNIGDTKRIELTTGKIITIRINGFYHDILSDGNGMAGISIEVIDGLDGLYPISEEGVAPEYPYTYMHNTVLPMLFAQLPHNVQSVIKTVKKTNWDSETTNDQVWLLSLAEVYSENGIVNSGNPEIRMDADRYITEGTQYEYYKQTIADSWTNNIINELSTFGWTRTKSTATVSGITQYYYIDQSTLMRSCTSAYRVRYGFCI